MPVLPHTLIKEEEEESPVIEGDEEFYAWGGLIEPEPEPQQEPQPLPQEVRQLEQKQLHHNDSTLSRDPDLPPVEPEKPWLPSRSNNIPGLFEDWTANNASEKQSVDLDISREKVAVNNSDIETIVIDDE